MIRFFEDKDIYAFDDFFLEDIMDREEYRCLYDYMFDQHMKLISVLNKGVCGNGGTTGFINYVLDSCKNGTGKGCLILVPNRSIVESKEQKLKDNPNVSFVYGGVRKFNTEAQVVIATYDQYPKLMKILKSASVKTEGTEMKFWSGRTIIIDEYHKLITESGFRDVCVGITDMIRKVDAPVVLMSATPYLEYVEMLQELLPDREIVNYNVIYNYNVRSSITVYDIKEERLLPVLRKMQMSSNNSHICVFYNCVEDIKNLAIQLGEECEVLCSSARKDKLKELYSKEFNPDKKIHFLTSAFFTGCDLPENVSEVIIVGSNEFDFMALDERDIKQILGRFRIDGGGVRYDHNSIFYLHKHTDTANYVKNKTDYDLKSIALCSKEYDWKTAEGGIEIKQSHIRLKKVLDTYQMWQSQDNLIEALSLYGFDTEIGDTTAINELGKDKKKKYIPFTKAKKMILKDKPVTVFQYPDINELMEYINVKGRKDFKYASKKHISSWYKVHMLIKDVELEGLSKQDLCDVFGIEENQVYPVRYLMECLDYLCSDWTYDNIPSKMWECFGVIAVDVVSFLHREWENKYVILSEKFSEKGGKKYPTLLIEDSKIYPPFQNFSQSTDQQSENTGKIPYIKFSYETGMSGHTSKASSDTMEDILSTGKVRSLAHNGDYQWMMKDKRNRLPVIKEDNERLKNIKMYGQTKMSELYIRNNTQFNFNKNNDYYADCLVCDIDGGMRLSDFNKKYGQWKYYAIPTFSNLEEDFNKFRVIIPLKYTIHLGSGKNNLKVLKCLRKLFCPYEDPQHQMYFQINLEDYQKTIINEGELFSVTQDTVNELHTYIDNCTEFKKNKVDVSTIDDKIEGKVIKHSRTWDMDKATTYCIMNDVDDNRHTSLFVIKNNIKKELLDEFGDWYRSFAGKRRYDKHWLGNSLID